ncbi:hypothetical protein DSECCO2_484680 [anaerobic digester metagenome]
MDAAGFHDRTDRAAGDDAGALGSGLEHDAAGAELTEHFIRQGAVEQGNVDHALARLLRGLADGLGNLVGLAQAIAHRAFAVADDDQGAEAEPAAALDDLGHAVEVHDLFDLTEVGLLVHAVFLAALIRI